MTQTEKNGQPTLKTSVGEFYIRDYRNPSDTNVAALETVTGEYVINGKTYTGTIYATRSRYDPVTIYVRDLWDELTDSAKRILVSQFEAHLAKYYPPLTREERIDAIVARAERTAQYAIDNLLNDVPSESVYDQLDENGFRLHVTPEELTRVIQAVREIVVNRMSR